jgi:AcrR family transcriptional regulator
MERISRREKERLSHEGEIVSAAEKLFIQNGFDKTSIDEIAREVQFTRRTIYQYFSNKEDLYYAVVLKGFRKLFEYFSTAISNGKDGFDKLYRAGLSYYQFYKDFPGTFQLMNGIGFVKADEALQPKRQEFLDFDDKMFQKFAQIIEEGKKDGSIRSDLDPLKGSYALAFVTTGFIHEISMTGHTFTSHMKIDMDEFIEYTYGLLSDSFRNSKETR